MDEVLILSAARTAIGSFRGAFSDLPAHALGSYALREAIERAGLQPADVDQVDLGCVLQAGQGQAPARQAAIGAVGLATICIGGGESTAMVIERI